MRTSSDGVAPSVHVVETVADRKDVSPLSLTPPLAAFVDPDALDALLRGPGGSTTFVAWGYHVTVAADGSVTVEDADDIPPVASPDRSGAGDDPSE